MQGSSAPIRFAANTTQDEQEKEHVRENALAMMKRLETEN
jgi:hypothetical protein